MNEKQEKILIVYTGGTIGMKKDEATGALTPFNFGAIEQEVPELQRFDVGIDAITFDPPIDSADVHPSHWVRLGRTIRDNYAAYAGFVVLHGTDTMAYTAAALSYLVQDSPKPVVLTGSQQPMAAPFTDAKLNLYQSLLWACDDAARDVHVVFDGKVIVGTRAHKQRTMSFNAFTSVNWPLAAIIRGGRVVRELGGAQAVAPSHARPTFYHQLDERVVVLKLTPGLRPEVFTALAGASSAVILETFGIGGIPTGFEETLFSWVDAGHTLVLTTQVPEEGLDLGVYEVGRAYADHPGILLGDDMTVEALVAKTMWVCGVTSGQKQLRRLFELPLNHDRLV